MNSIAVQNLSKSYKKKKVVSDVSLEVKKGEIVGLLGPNGAGKTTTFYMIVGIIKPNSGKVLYNERDITKFPMHKRAALGMGYLAQEPSVFRNLTVEENLEAILEMKKYSPKKIKKIKEEILEEFKITHIAKNLGFSLSGGERRRVEIARTIANNPDFILLDEPFAGVDPIAVEDIQKIILYLKNKGLGILITDHSVRETLSITERAYIMSEGKILLSGTSESISKNETAKKIYLGENFKL